MKALYMKLKITAGVFLLAILAVSCVPEQESMGDAGQTLVKLNPEGFKLVPFNVVSSAQSAAMFEVRRDINSVDALNSTTTVTLKVDNTLLTAYNTEHSTSFEPLPVSLATTEPAPAADGTVILTFNAGDFAKALIVKVPNSTLFDFSKQYALGYKIVSVSGTGKLSEAVGKEIVVQVGVKNKYDGVYEVTANSPMVDILNAALTGYYPFKYEMRTTGAHSVICWDITVWDDAMHPISNAGAASGYGSFGLIINFDPSGNGNIASVQNPWGNPPGNTRMPVIDPSGVNKWNEATKILKFKYWMIQPSLVPAAPSIRTYFDETWTYKGPR